MLERLASKQGSWIRIPARVRFAKKSRPLLLGNGRDCYSKNVSWRGFAASRARIARTADRVPHMSCRTNPCVADRGRYISVVDVVLNRINEIGQLLTCRTRMPYGKSILRGFQLSDQALL